MRTSLFDLRQPGARMRRRTQRVQRAPYNKTMRHPIAAMAVLTVLFAVTSIRSSAQGVSDALNYPVRRSIAATVKPVKLGTRARCVQLQSMPSGRVGALEASLAQLGHRRLYLLLGRLATNAQPGVLYDVFLDAPCSGKWTPDAAHHVGTVNFFGVPAKASDEGPAVSFDVTETVQALKALRRLRPQTTVTIMPLGTASTKARPVIGCVKIVEQ